MLYALTFNAMSVDQEISRVAVRVSPVWRDNINVWFGHLEAQFSLANITDDKTKFHYVVSALDSELSSYVADIIMKPPTEKPYDIIKQRLIDQFSESESTRIRTLLCDMTLGDQKPSQLLHKMSQMSAHKLPDDVLKMLWLQRLPITVQQILTTSSDKIEDLAVMADKISEISGLSVSSIQNSTETEDLRERVMELEKALSKLSTRNRSRSRSRKPRSKSPHPKQYSQCWYHFKFGNRALKCKQPCDFQEN